MQRQNVIQILRTLILLVLTLLTFTFIIAVVSAQQSYVVNINEGLGVSTGDDKNKKNSSPFHYKVNVYEKIRIGENLTIDSRSVVIPTGEVKVNDSQEDDFYTERRIIPTWAKVLIWIAIAIIVLFVIYFIWSNWNMLD
jgi:hypothetical protein